ncbi:MAG: UPF0175 family protein [Spirochaetes bacterium]|nr:UPF0175 family protein [Spirochaetota bacterium]
MTQISIELPDTVLLSMGGSLEKLKDESTLLLASQLFAKGYLSSGQAAAICKMTRIEFLTLMSKWNIPVADIEPDEMQSEFSE